MNAAASVTKILLRSIAFVFAKLLTASMLLDAEACDLVGALLWQSHARLAFPTSIRIACTLEQKSKPISIAYFI